MEYLYFNSEGRSALNWAPDVFTTNSIHGMPLRYIVYRTECRAFTMKLHCILQCESINRREGHLSTSIRAASHSHMQHWVSSSWLHETYSPFVQCPRTYQRMSTSIFAGHGVVVLIFAPAIARNSPHRFRPQRSCPTKFFEAK